jgi:hypothetical protein
MKTKKGLHTKNNNCPFCFGVCEEKRDTMSKANGLTERSEGHTPTPWHYETTKWANEFDHKIVSKTGEVIAHLNNTRLNEHLLPEDAAFIVRAVNRYQEAEDELVSLRENNRALLEAAKMTRKYFEHDSGFSTKSLLETVEKAIARAEGGK